MPFKIIRDDLTRVKVDAIVNAANESLLGGGGVDGAIHAAAGPELLAECRTIGGCATGQAVLTKGYQLPAKYVIHTVGPIWQDGTHNEEALLANCYRNALALAKERNFESVAFPLISSGIYGYPKDQALATAISEISQFLLHNDMDVTLVVFDPTAFQLSGKLLHSVKEYIDDWFVEKHIRKGTIVDGRRFERHQDLLANATSKVSILASPKIRLAEPANPYNNGLENLLGHLDESFSESLLRRIDEKGMTDVQAYRKANVTRQVFSRIRSNSDYKPKKSTAIAFAIALKLSLGESLDLLRTAGFTLSRSSRTDMIIQHFIENGNYDIFEINSMLFHYKQKLLGE